MTVSHTARGAASQGAPASALVTLAAPRSPAAEAYRTLRTNLQFSALDRATRVVLVTSASPGEGKSTVLANLAVVAGETGARVIAVDTDLRRPRLHEMFGVARSPGFSDAVLEGPGGRPPLQETSAPNVRVLASGTPPPNPAEVLASQRGAALIALLADDADLVLLDSPPIGPLADAAVLAGRADGVVLVIRSGKTARSAVSQARAQLERIGARLLGAVLNEARLDPAMKRYYAAG